MAHEPRPNRVPLASRIGIGPIEIVAFAAILALAAVARGYALGARTFTADEGVASLVARQLALGGGYEHLPVLHGPLHYVVTAALFRALGESDATARLAPALFGVLLAALPMLWRGGLGRVGAIVASLLLAVSPVMLYYSRFAGPEIYLAFFTLALAIALWRYLETEERAWLYAMSAALAFMVVSSEMALVIAPIFIAYLAYRTGSALVAQMCDARTHMASGGASHYALLGIAEDADARDVRKAYRALVERAETRHEREALAHAYGVLTSAQRRQAYDRQLARRRIVITQAPHEHGLTGRTAVFALAAPIAIAWPCIGGVRRRLGLSALPAPASAMLVLGLLTLPFYGPLVQQLGFIGDRGFAGQQTVYRIGGADYVPGGELPVMLATLGALFAFAGIAGLAWRWHAWVICWAVFYGIAFACFTGFFTHQGGVWTGLWGTLDYWYRPDADVTTGPPYYYGMLLGLYEFVPVCTAALGALFMLARGELRDRAVAAVALCGIALLTLAPASLPLVGAHRVTLMLALAGGAVLMLRLPERTKFLAFWAVMAFFAFIIVRPKEPWLALHLALPLALLAASIINDAVAAMAPSRADARASLAAAWRPRLAQAMAGAAVAAAAAVALHSGLLAAWGHGDVPQLQGALATHDRGDAPVEMLQAQQTSPDVRAIRDAIARAGVASGEGRQIPIVLDTSYDFARGWMWYLRDYPNLQLRDLRAPASVPDGAIVLANSRNRFNALAPGDSLGVTFTQRWGFPRGAYAGLTPAGVASALASDTLWAYIGDRTSIGPLPATEGVAFFPQALSASLPAARESAVLSLDVGPRTP